MLRPDVAEACAAGRFHVYAVRHVHAGIELLTGKSAGELAPGGGWPDGSVNRLVQDRLIASLKLVAASERPMRPEKEVRT